MIVAFSLHQLFRRPLHIRHHSKIYAKIRIYPLDYIYIYNILYYIYTRLYPSIGEMYPAGTELLSKVDDEAKLADALRSFPEYHAIFEKLSTLSSEEFSIDDEFYRQEVRLYELAFEGQCHFGVFYAYVKLKEQEIRNLVWISECILQRRKESVMEFIPVFSKHSEWRCESTRKSGGH